jgi:hypothetical protein
VLALFLGPSFLGVLLLDIFLLDVLSFVAGRFIAGRFAAERFVVGRSVPGCLSVLLLGSRSALPVPNNNINILPCRTIYHCTSGQIIRLSHHLSD